MAKPLEFTPRQTTPEERMDAQIHDSLPALEDSLKLLQELHKHGVLELLIKLVRGGEGLAAGALHTLGSDAMLQGIRNLVELARIVGTLNPSDVRQLAQGVGAAAEYGARNAQQGVKVTPLELPKMLLDPDVQLALGAVSGLLKGLGQGLRASTTEEKHAQR